MMELTVFLYGMLTSYILLSARRNRDLGRPNPAMVTAVGWGLFSMSSTLAVLLGAVALALAFGIHVPGAAELAALK